MQTLSLISTKGGVGKTTTAANLAALMADAGLRVLLVDLDVQPTLSSYFPLQSEAVGGILQFIALNETRFAEIISKTAIERLDLIKSNDDSNQLSGLLLNAADGRLRLLRQLPIFEDHYDLVVIDTQGARSVTLEMALLASDIAVSPVIPEMLAAREFRRGTTSLFNELQTYRLMQIELPELLVFINRADAVSSDARLITESLKETFAEDDSVTVLETAIPGLSAYRSAATLSMPAHRYEPKKPSGRKTPSALDSMKALAMEIFPEHQARIAALCPEHWRDVPVAVTADIPTDGEEA